VDPNQNPDAGAAWAWAAMEPEPTDEDRKLLDLFCQEYLVDESATKAASRCGFQAGFAEQYGALFITKSYVQRRLVALRHAKVDEKAREQYDKRVVMNVLREVASNQMQRASARVAAAGRMASILGMDAPKKGASAASGKVLVMPYLSREDWEQQVPIRQAKLQEETLAALDQQV
jgi:Terminase small subunit